MDAKIHTTRNGYALDSFMLLDVSGRDGTRTCSPTSNTNDRPPDASGGARSAGRGRLSRQVKHFPIQPTVTIQADEKDQDFVLSVSAADRPGLLTPSP